MDSNIGAETFSTIKNPAKDAFVRSLAEYEKKKEKKKHGVPARVLVPLASILNFKMHF